MLGRLTARVYHEEISRYVGLSDIAMAQITGSRVMVAQGMSTRGLQNRRNITAIEATVGGQNSSQDRSVDTRSYYLHWKQILRRGQKNQDECAYDHHQRQRATT